MAKKSKRRVRDTWREKSWYTIKTPVAFEDKEIGETPAKDADLVIGRTIAFRDNKKMPDGYRGLEVEIFSLERKKELFMSIFNDNIKLMKRGK